MTEQHIIIDSKQTIEAMLAPVDRDLLHYQCNNPPDAGKHCLKLRPSAAPNIIVTPLAAKSSYRPKRANCSAHSLHQTRAFTLLQSTVAPCHDYRPQLWQLISQQLWWREELQFQHIPSRLIFPLLLPIQPWRLPFTPPHRQHRQPTHRQRLLASSYMNWQPISSTDGLEYVLFWPHQTNRTISLERHTTIHQR